MRKISLAFLIIGMVLLFFSVDFSISGSAIGEQSKISNYLMLAISIISFTSSILILSASKALEAILIPTGGPKTSKERANTAGREYEAHNEDYILVSGEIQRDDKGRPKKNADQVRIYRELRKKYGVTPKDMIIEDKSRDSLENFVYSVEKLKKKGIKKVKIATNETQYWRFKMFEDQAKREGMIPGDFEMEHLQTAETTKQTIYGIIALVKDAYRVMRYGSLKGAVNNKTGKFGRIIRNSLKRKSTSTS